MTSKPNRNGSFGGNPLPVAVGAGEAVPFGNNVKMTETEMLAHLNMMQTQLQQSQAQLLQMMQQKQLN